MFDKNFGFLKKISMRIYMIKTKIIGFMASPGFKSHTSWAVNKIPEGAKEKRLKLNPGVSAKA
jgi:hypothetical protein